MKVVTGDILVDITGRNVSEYLLFTSDRLRLHRWDCHWMAVAEVPDDISIKCHSLKAFCLDVVMQRTYKPLKCLFLVFFLSSTDFVLYRYGGITVGNIQKSIPASFGRKIPPMVRKIAVRRSAQVRRAF